MQDGSWTIERCEHRDVAALAAALEISEITASILVRRGLRDPGDARAFLAGERAPHDPFLLGDMAVRQASDCTFSEGLAKVNADWLVHGQPLAASFEEKVAANPSKRYMFFSQFLARVCQ